MKPPGSQSPLAPQNPPHCEEAVAFRREMDGAGELATFSNTKGWQVNRGAISEPRIPLS